MGLSMKVRLGWWMVGLIPVAGILVSFALPPFDEYAAFDRVGDRFQPESGLAFDIGPTMIDVPTQPAEDGKRRGWRLRLSEAEAARFVDRFVAPDRGWQRSGSGSGSSSTNDGTTSVETRSVSTTYTNDDTGDELEFDRETQTTPERKVVRLEVRVWQSRSQGVWGKIKRWARLTFRR